MNPLVLLPVFWSMAHCQVWSQIPGEFHVFSARSAADGVTEMWGTDYLGNILRWNGTGWKYTLGTAQYVAAAHDGRAWVIRTDLWTGNIWRYVIAVNGYENIGGSLHQISAYSGDSAVGVNYVGDIWHWDGGWKQLPGKANKAAIGPNKDIWMIDAHSNIYHLENGQWLQKPGNAKYIDIHNSSRIVMTDFSMNLYYWDDNDWKQIVGPGQDSTSQRGTVQGCVRASVTRDKVFCQDIVGAVYWSNF